MSKSGSIALASDLRSFFENECWDAVQRQGVKISELTNSYVASVLARYSSSQEYFVPNKDSEKKREVPSIVTLWLEGLSGDTLEQYRQMQFVGDIALFTSGFFSDRIERSLVDMDFYTAIGGQAYERAGKLRESIAAERSLNVFFELSSKFPEIKEVLAEISDRALLGSEQGRLKLFERWMQTKNARLRRMLAENGILTSDEGS
jgi:hypothetical protein